MDAQPQPTSDANLMREILPVFRGVFDYLFPQQAKAVATGQSALTISWPMHDDPHARFVYATPITIRFEPELVEALRSASLGQRYRILKRQEGALRAGMMGYDPYAAIPKARIIVLG